MRALPSLKPFTCMALRMRTGLSLTLHCRSQGAFLVLRRLTGRRLGAEGGMSVCHKLKPIE